MRERVLEDTIFELPADAERVDAAFRTCPEDLVYSAAFYRSVKASPGGQGCSMLLSFRLRKYEVTGWTFNSDIDDTMDVRMEPVRFSTLHAALSMIANQGFDISRIKLQVDRRAF